MLNALLLVLSGFLLGYSFYAKVQLKDSFVWSMRAMAFVCILIVLLNPPV